MVSKCPFCSESCRNDHCPYAGEKEDSQDDCKGLKEENLRLKDLIKDLQKYIGRDLK